MKKWINTVFVAGFLALLLMPFLTMNLKKHEISEIDNEYLPEITGNTVGEYIKSAEEYATKRIGFRTEALDFYQVLNDRCFGLMEHPVYMYGKEGEVFYKMPYYIEDYQHLNLAPGWTQEFVTSLRGFSDFCNKEGKQFIYLFIPDKKTVYSEYFPDEYLGNCETSSQF